MKRLSSAFLILAAALLLSGCGDKPQYTDYTGYLTTASTPSPAMQNAPSGFPSVPQDTSELDFSSVVSVVTPSASGLGTGGYSSAPAFSADTPQDYGQYQAPASGNYNVVQMAPQTPVPAPAPTPTPIPTPAPTVYVPTVKITKSPTSETLKAGGSAMFIAHAENSNGIVWITVSPDKQISYQIEEAPKHFPGLSVNGQFSDVLYLEHIPESMNGWRIQAYFTGNGGPLYTAGAYLTVTKDYKPGEPGGTAEQYCQYLANQANDILFNYAVKNGFSSSGISNYSYANTISDFNVTFTRGAYTLVGEFKSYYYSDVNYGFGPVHVIVYNNGMEWLSMHLTDKTIDYFDNILYEYSIK